MTQKNLTPISFINHTVYHTINTTSH